jgi:DNA-binding CsgD family transcriptional regulator
MLAETAVALDIAATTAKTHLDHIFSKTGSRAKPIWRGSDRACRGQY